MYVMIDNYDSFVYNLTRYFEELGCEMMVLRHDVANIEVLEDWYQKGMLEGIILSPGPKTPIDCGCCGEIVLHFLHRVPILGVCLGHQVIAHFLGGKVIKGERPMHGKVTPIFHKGEGLFQGLPSPYQVTRYHSLIADVATLPSCLLVDAVTEDGVVMALRHKSAPLYGVQFHPEAVMTEYGHALLKNFVTLSERWCQTNASQKADDILSA